MTQNAEYFACSSNSDSSWTCVFRHYSCPRSALSTASNLNHVASLSIGHWGTFPPSSFGNSVHSAAAASLTVKISKITKERHAKTQVNRLKQSRNPKEIPGRGGEDKILAMPPHLISWRRH